MSSKGKQVWAILADISPYRWEVNENSHIAMKNFKINPFVIKSVLEPNCKRFRKSANREKFNQKPQARKKKLNPKSQLTTPISTMKWKRSWSQFPSFMSEQFLSTRSKTYMHLKNFKFYLIFAVRKQTSGTTRATNEQVHQQGSLTWTKLSQYTK